MRGASTHGRRRSAFARLPRMLSTKLLRNRWGPSLSVALALVLGLSACGGGETTVASNPPQQEDGQQTTSTEIESGAVTGYVDYVQSKSGSMVLTGWAASSDLSEPATKVTVSVAGKPLSKAVPTIERQDVVEALGKAGLKESGFELRLPLESLECDSPAAGIEVTGSLDGESGALNLGEGIEKAITESC